MAEVDRKSFTARHLDPGSHMGEILFGRLFFVGWRAARHTLAKPWIAGIVFLLVGVLLVALAIPLGG